MGVGTPFHARASIHCASLRWREWAGCFAASSYDTNHALEYQAFRHAAGMLDASPLQKVRVRGRDARRLLDLLVVRDLSRLTPGRMVYTLWCDEAGRVVDDGTVACLTEEDFRLATNDPGLAWVAERAVGLEVEVADETEAVAVLAVQGPRSRAVLEAAGGGDAVADLSPFALAAMQLGAMPAVVSRSGFTGDLGYEIWIDADHALALWDLVLAAGHPHGLIPAGLLALDMCRVEAGYLLAGVDYTSARRALSPEQAVTPAELGCGWMVDLQKPSRYVGRAAVERQQRDGAPRTRVGVVSSWDALERLYSGAGLPPHLPDTAWREFRELSDRRGRQIGHATSGVWSPLLKSDLALGFVEARFARPGTEIWIEHVVEFERHRVRAEVKELPFIDSARRHG